KLKCHCEERSDAAIQREFILFRENAKMINTLVVFVGAGLGGVLRHGVNSAAAMWLGIAFPYGTFAVNIIGSFLMGLLVGYFALKGSTIPHIQLFLATGVLGGF